MITSEDAVQIKEAIQSVKTENLHEMLTHKEKLLGEARHKIRMYEDVRDWEHEWVSQLKARIAKECP